MSLVTPTLGDVFTFSATAYNQSNPSQKWTNNLTIYTRASTSLFSLRQCAARFGVFLSYMSLQSTFIEKVRISTYEPDTNPYQGSEFTNVDINLTGQRPSAVDDALALEVCLYVKKVTQVGRNGKLFLRGVLREGDVSFGQSLFAPTDATALDNLMNTALESSLFDSTVSGGDSDFAVALVKLDAGEYLIRQTVAFSIGGIRTVNMNHRYYDRN